MRRSDTNRMVAGVCGGIAEHLRVDAVLIRIIAVVAAVLTCGGAVLAYAFAYLVMPAPHGDSAPLDRWQSHP